MIEVLGLRKAYAGRTVLVGVDLTVRPGELVALLGPNGAGKTTTVEIVEGYRSADAGTVRVLGEDPRRGGAALRARVGLMLQGGAGLEPRASVRDLVRLYSAFHDVGRRADELIAQVGLDAVAGTRVRRLSGGERQRLSLALALAGDPEVLILDEPTAGMDPEARRSTRALVAGLRDEGRAILLTTHDLGDVEHLADRVAILHDGRIVADDAPESLVHGGDAAVRFRLHAPPGPAAIDRLRRRLDSLQRSIGLRAVGDGAVGDRAVGDGPPAPAADPARPPAPAPTDPQPRDFEIAPGAASADVVAELAQWALREGALIVELRAGAASLEERYLALTQDRDVEDVA